jgi:hypothetical protein
MPNIHNLKARTLSSQSVELVTGGPPEAVGIADWTDDKRDPASCPSCRGRFFPARCNLLTLPNETFATPRQAGEVIQMSRFVASQNAWKPLEVSRPYKSVIHLARGK